VQQFFCLVRFRVLCVGFCRFSKEIEKAKSKKMKYDFRYFLLISKTYRFHQPPRKGKKRNPGAQQDSLQFVNAEEKLFYEVSLR